MKKKILYTKKPKSVNLSQETISPLSLQDLGNFEYTALPRDVKYLGIVVKPNKWAIKLYSLLFEGEIHPNSEKMIVATNLAIEHKYKKQEIMLHSGLGFAIISPGFINVSRWGGDYPSIVNPYVFSFSENKRFIDIFPSQLKKENIEKIGAYCAWELGIAQYEAAAWREYLFNNESNPKLLLNKKIKYLENSYQGTIGKA